MAISLISTLSRIFTQRSDGEPAAAGLRGRTSVPGTTGPLDIIRKRRVLVIADAQNLDYSARDIGCKMSWRSLGEVLDKACSRCSRHVIFSRNAGQNQRVAYYAARGWQTHARLNRTVQTMNGAERKSNADFLLAFIAGRLSGAKWDIVIIASGDGDLVEDVAEGILSLGSVRTVITLSLAGSTAWRLDARRSSLITGNIKIGLDCLHSRNVMRRRVSSIRSSGRFNDVNAN